MTPWQTQKADIETITKAVVAAMSATSKIQPNAQSESWHCQRADCLYANKGWANWAGRRVCQGCFKPRQAATNPRPDQRIARTPRASSQQAPDPAAAASKELRKEVRKAKRQARADFQKNKQKDVPKGKEAETTSQAPPPTSAQKETPQTTATNKLAFSQQMLDDMPLLPAQLLLALVQSLEAEHIPADTELKPPEEILNRCIGEKGPTAKATQRAKIESEIAQLKSSIVWLSDEGLADSVKHLEEQVKSRESALAKLVRDAPSQNVEAKAIAEVKSAYELRAQARRDNEAKGQTKAVERRTFRHKHVADLIGQLTLADKFMTTLEEDNSRKHAARAAAAADLDVKVLALFDQKLAKLAAPPVPAPPVQPQAPVAPVQAPAQSSQGGTVAVIQAPLALTAPPAPDASKDAQIATLLASLKRFERAAAPMTEFDRHVEVDPTTIPRAKVPNPQAGKAYFAIHRVLELWQAAGAYDAFTWAALARFAVENGSPLDIAKEVLGQAWSMWYPVDPASDAIVPRHLALQIHYCLNGIKMVSDQEEQDSASLLALEGYKEISSAAKRRRQE